MAHFAKLDSTNNVIGVHVLNNEVITDADGNEQEQVGIDFLTQLHGGTWKQTSYNATIRKNYAGVGFTYDETRDAFIPPQPFDSWLLNEDTCQWESPVPYPSDNKMYEWDEDIINWIEITE
jgi:hypothetical protein